MAPAPGAKNFGHVVANEELLSFPGMQTSIKVKA